MDGDIGKNMEEQVLSKYSGTQVISPDQKGLIDSRNGTISVAELFQVESRRTR